VGFKGDSDYLVEGEQIPGEGGGRGKLNFSIRVPEEDSYGKKKERLDYRLPRLFRGQEKNWKNFLQKRGEGKKSLLGREKHRRKWMIWFKGREPVPRTNQSSKAGVQGRLPYGVKEGEEVL